jgi:hypothetical protein
MIWREEFADGSAAGALIFFSFASGGFLITRGVCTVMRVSIGLAPVPLSLALLVGPLPAFSLPTLGEVPPALPFAPALSAVPLEGALPSAGLPRALFALPPAGRDSWGSACADGLVVVVSLAAGALSLAAGTASSANPPLTVNAPATTIVDRDKRRFKPISL